MVGRPLEPDGAPELVSPEPVPAAVVVVEEAPELPVAAVDDPVPDDVSPDDVVEEPPTVVEVVGEDDVVGDEVLVDEELVDEVVVVEVVVVPPADTAGLPEPCTATPTTPATKTAVMRPPRARREATGADLPSQTTHNF